MTSFSPQCWLINVKPVLFLTLTGKFNHSFREYLVLQLRNPFSIWWCNYKNKVASLSRPIFLSVTASFCGSYTSITCLTSLLWKKDACSELTPSLKNTQFNIFLLLLFICSTWCWFSQLDLSLEVSDSTSSAWLTTLFLARLVKQMVCISVGQKEQTKNTCLFFF